MASNVTANAGSGGSTFVTAQCSHDGDTAQLPGQFLMGISGTEDSYTVAKINGDATNGLDVDVTRVGGTVTIAGAVTNAGTFAVQVDGAALTALQLIDNLVLAEDAAHASGDPGVQVFSVRRDTAAALGADGDYQPLVTDSTGRLWCNVSNTVAVTGTVTVSSGTVTVDSGTVSIGNSPTVVLNGEKAEDAAHANGATGVYVLAVRSDTAAATGQTDGDYTSLVTDSSGRLWTAAVQSGTWNIGTVTAVTSISNALPAGTNNIGDVDVLSIAAGDNNIGNVDVVTLPAVTNAGTFAVQVDGAALTSLQLADDVVFVDDAAFTPATSKVNAIGCQADETATDSVDEGDIGCPRMTLDRKIHVVTETESNSMRTAGVACTPKYAVIDAATSGDNTLVSAVASRKLRVLSAFLVSAGTVNVRFESGASGTALTGQMNLVANTGFVLPYNPAGWFETASNTLLNLELSGAVSVDGNLTYIEVT